MLRTDIFFIDVAEHFIEGGSYLDYAPPKSPPQPKHIVNVPKLRYVLYINNLIFVDTKPPELKYDGKY